MASLPNRYADPRDDAMDDADWDEWMAKSEEEIDRELDVAMRRYVETVALLTPAQLYAGRRRTALRQCITWRGLMREHDFLGRYLKSTQVRMVKLRIQRATGVYPGEA